MLAEGIVTRINGERAYVKVQRPEGCGRCHEVGGCGGVAQGESRCQEFLVDNPCVAKEGQRVSLEIPEGTALKTVLLVYGFPLIATLIGAGIASALWGSDFATACGAAVCLGLAVAVLYGLHSIGFVHHAQPRATGILSQ